MDNKKDKILNDIFNDDPLGLLNVKSKKQTGRTADDRLRASFEEINRFVEEHDREPGPSVNISEFTLYTRLKTLKEDQSKTELLKPFDKFNLLGSFDNLQEPPPEYQKNKKKEINSIDDIFEDDSLNLLDDSDTSLFDFKHTPADLQRAEADFVARRKPCKDFEKYKDMFRQVQNDLTSGKRELIPFKQDNLKAGEFYVHNGVLLYLEKVEFEKEIQPFKSGPRIRKDGRTRTIFENGTESSMLYRSLYKAILANGKAVTHNKKKQQEEFAENFNSVTTEDEEAGYIYVLKSKSTDPQISSIKNLYKIGFSRTEIPDRIKNADNEPTYLMAPVEYVAGWKCFNMNPQKFEQLIHNFFGDSCLEIDVFDEKGKRHTPREWFIVPYHIIEQAITLIINGSIIHYKYDPTTQSISERANSNSP